MLASFRSRVALTNLAITLIALLVLTFVFTQLLRQHSIDVAQNGVSKSASQLARDVNREQSRVRNKDINAQGMYNYFWHDSKLLGNRVIFYSGNGLCGFDSKYYRRVATTQGNGCLAGNYSQWRLSPISLHRSLSRFVRSGSRTFLVTQRPTREGAVALVTDASSVIPTWSTIAPVFLVASLAAAIVFVLIAVYFAYAVSRPLGRVTAAAVAMSRGDYSQRVNVSGSGEIEELGRSFNHMATQVAASHQLLKDFVANVSHDLRTPLTIISGYADSLLDGTARNESEWREGAAVIAGEAVRMQHLVDNLLQLTRLESGLRKFDQKPVSVRSLVESTIRRTAGTADGRIVTNVVPENMPLAWADEELVERVLMNLLSNALEYTPPGGTIEIGARLHAGWIQVSVSDTGSGIRLEDQARIFERFYRVDKGRSRESGHSGLGLPIVKEIIEAHGGALDLESTPGRGSTFRFTIPRFSPQT